MYKLLIADDEAFERKTMRFILKKSFANLEIIEDAKTGDEAVQLSRKYKPHIIIMDIKMPEKNGLEAQKSIIKFLPNIKTIILTAYDNFSFAQSAIKLGVVDYILKPVKPDELKESLNKAIYLLKNEDTNLNSFSDSSHDTDSIHEALKFINKNFSENITLESVSEHVHLTSHYFSRYFKNSTGVNFIEYLTKLRIKEAKRLLVSTSKSISRISLDIGYVDSAYFSKVFMKYEGVSPHKYRLNEKRHPLDLEMP